MILKGSEEANALKKEHIKQARRALEACKSWRTKTSKDARNNRIRCLEAGGGVNLVGGWSRSIRRKL